MISSLSNRIIKIYKAVGLCVFSHNLLLLILPSLFSTLSFNIFASSSSTLAPPPTIHNPDTTANTLREIVVTGNRGVGGMRILSDGNITLTPENMKSGVRVMGENDLLGALKAMSGISSVSDYGAGLVVDGSESSHTLYMVNNAPIFFPYRFGGIFSTFNSDHFNKATFERGIHNASMPLRIGGNMQLSTGQLPDSLLSADINVGLISSSATIKVPVTKKFSFKLSARQAYINQIYQGLLRFETSAAKYNFHDFNLSAAYKINSRDNISFTSLYSADDVNYDDPAWDMGMLIKWTNSLASATWNHSGNLPFYHTIYYSGFNGKLNLSIPELKIESPNRLQEYGIKGFFQLPGSSSRFNLSSGYELNFTNLTPQYVVIRQASEQNSTKSKIITDSDLRLFGDMDIDITENFRFSCGISLNGRISNNGYKDLSPDLRLTGRYFSKAGEFSIHAGTYTQYLQQVGFSSTGVASDFWITSNNEHPAMRALNCQFSWSAPNLSIPGNFNANIYYKRIWNQMEYFGDIIDLLTDDYSSEKYIISGNGFNAGGNIAYTLNIPIMSLSASAGYGIAKRKYPGFEKSFNSVTSPGLSLKLQSIFFLSNHFDLAATFCYNTGRPYTPISEMYIIAGNIVSKYGDLNSAHLPDYHRLDLSATYHFITKLRKFTLRHHINASIINAYGHRNVDLQTYRIDTETNTIYLKQVSSLYRFMPSLSYSISF